MSIQASEVLLPIPFGCVQSREPAGLPLRERIGWKQFERIESFPGLQALRPVYELRGFCIRCHRFLQRPQQLLLSNVEAVFESVPPLDKSLFESQV